MSVGPRMHIHVVQIQRVICGRNTICIILFYAFVTNCERPKQYGQTDPHEHSRLPFPTHATSLRRITREK